MNEKVVAVPRWIFWLLLGFIVVGIGLLAFTGTKYGSLNHQAKEYRREIEESRRTIATLRDELDGATEHLQQLEDELTASQDELEQAKENTRQLRDELNNAVTYNQQLEESISALTGGVGEVGTFVGSARDEIQQLIEDLQKTEGSDSNN